MHDINNNNISVTTKTDWVHLHVSFKVIFPAAASFGKMILKEPYKSLVLKYSLGKTLVSLCITWKGNILIFVSWSDGALAGGEWESQAPGNRAGEETVVWKTKIHRSPALPPFPPPWSEFWAHSLQSNVAEWQETPFLGLMEHKCSCFKKTD